ncbi:riboflavin synthase [bacterium]|nr:MAG: riboflavin synthase [bacterium]
MFTGIIEGAGSVVDIQARGASALLSVEAPFDISDVPVGGSIAVDGACLTVTGFKKNVFTADVSHETLKFTTLGGLSRGSSVNLEKPLTLSKPLGGHMVSGHVDFTGLIRGKAQKGEYLEFEITAPDVRLAQLVKKGSVAIDGISLTVTEVTHGAFKILLIPHTMKNTALPRKAEGARVNIETDIIAKYVEKLFASRRAESNVTEGFLLEHGFMKKF